MAKENERIAFDKIENGYIVKHSYEEVKGEKFNYIEKAYYTKNAKETREKMIELQKTMKI